MIRWEWEGNGNKKVIPAHLYGAVQCAQLAQVSYKTVDSVANANKTTVTNKPYTM